jgi:hypothetical protein
MRASPWSEAAPRQHGDSSLRAVLCDVINAVAEFMANQHGWVQAFGVPTRFEVVLGLVRGSKHPRGMLLGHMHACFKRMRARFKHGSQWYHRVQNSSPKTSTALPCKIGTPFGVFMFGEAPASNTAMHRSTSPISDASNSIASKSSLLNRCKACC